jgi:hypothetical protein
MTDGNGLDDAREGEFSHGLNGFNRWGAFKNFIAPHPLNPFNPWLNSPSLLLQHVVSEISYELANFERLFFDEPRTLKSLWTELFKLHQFGVRQHHPNSIVQVVKPLLDLVFIHKALG